jgi:hypothetical protein
MVPSSRTPLRPDRLRALNLPSSVEVVLDVWGQPTCVRQADTDERDGVRSVDEIVETWIVQDEWWRAPIHRRYVEVVLDGGAHVVLFEDLITGEWFMQKP